MAGSTPRILEIPGESGDSAYVPSLVNLGSNSLGFPQALAVDNTGGNLYVGDGNNNQILQISSQWHGLYEFPDCTLRWHHHLMRAELACGHCV